MIKDVSTMVEDIPNGEGLLRNMDRQEEWIETLATARRCFKGLIFRSTYAEKAAPSRRTKASFGRDSIIQTVSFI
jgi:hypothetical protein